MVCSQKVSTMKYQEISVPGTILTEPQFHSSNSPMMVTSVRFSALFKKKKKRVIQFQGVWSVSTVPGLLMVTSESIVHRELFCRNSSKTF